MAAVLAEARVNFHKHLTDRSTLSLSRDGVASNFEEAAEAFLMETFPIFQSLRPGGWIVENVGGSPAEYQISKYEPFAHLAALAIAIE